MSEERLEGVVKWFNTQKGYGFITTPKKPDVFVHYTAILAESGTYRQLAEGDKVKFRLVQGKKGLQAEEVEVIHEEG